MTQTNTTQNKEELEERWKLAERRCSEVIDLDQEPPVKYINIRAKTALKELRELKELVDKSISQAHQSGIEEARKAILEEVRSYVTAGELENFTSDGLASYLYKKLSILEGKK